MAQFHVRGRYQYKTQAEGDACDAWMTDWVTQHQSDIASGSHSMTNTLNPNSNEGCVVQLDFNYNFDADQSLYDPYTTAWDADLAALGTPDCESNIETGSGW